MRMLNYPEKAALLIAIAKRMQTGWLISMIALNDHKELVKLLVENGMSQEVADELVMLQDFVNFCRELDIALDGIDVRAGKFMVERKGENNA